MTWTTTYDEYVSELVRRPRAYRCWFPRGGAYACLFTSDSYSECQRYGGLVLKYPLTPESTTNDD
jgi:hypothetical protein